MILMGLGAHSITETQRIARILQGIAREEQGFGKEPASDLQGSSKDLARMSLVCIW